MALIIVLVNKSNLAPVSDYSYQVLIGDGSAERSHTIEQGVVTGHTRADGWAKLAEMLLEQREGK